MKKLFLPYLYGFNTRARSKVHKVSFFMLIVLPIFLNIFLLNNFVLDIFLFFLAFTAMYLVYEIGYIYNDVFTVKKEEKPTQWLTKKNVEFVNDNYLLLISSRVIYILLLMMVIRHISPYNYELFVVSLILLYFVFSLHNSFRGWINIITDGLLQILKYGSIFLLFLNGKDLLLAYIYIYIEIAFLRTLEFGIGKKYILKKLQNVNMDSFRLIYYLCMLVISAVLGIFSEEVYPLSIGLVYLLIYRILCKIMTLNKKIVEIRSTNGKGEK